MIQRTPVRLIGLAGSLAAAALLATSAAGDSTTITDPAGDTTAQDLEHLDIRKATAAHAEGRLKHIVKVDDASRFTKRGTFVFIRAQAQGFRVEKDGVFQGDTRVGGATAERAGDRIKFFFGRNAIGAPDRYRWQAFTAAPDSKPFDAAPDNRAVLHDLG